MLQRKLFAIFLACGLCAAASAAEITFDFESGDLRGWTATGTAFQNQPTEGDNANLRGRPANPIGRYWIGTFENCRAGGKPGETQGDEPTGTLTSAPFKLEKPWISFMIGGGKNRDEVYVAVSLAKNGTEIFRATGEESESMRRVNFDASQYLGQDLSIKIVDNGKGPWGHINFDDFKQIEKPAVEKTLALANGLAPQDAVKSMKLPEGFSATLFASEPEIHQPIAFCFDERGRIWLLECYEYPRGQPVGKKGTDRILILEDTTGSGKADKIKVFYEGLNLATGIEVGYGGVFVGAAPDLLFIPDRNHDDIPDGEPEVLLHGFGRQDTHELLNSLTWGPDGWLYGCSGVFVPSKVQDVSFTCSIWRYHPIAKKFELFAEGGSNQWGVDFNDTGNAFFTACVIPHIYHVVPGGLYIRQGGQNSNPYAYGQLDTIADHRHFMGNQWNDNDRQSSDSLGGGHAHCGAMIYLGDSFPEEYRDTILMGNLHGNRVNRDILVRKGSSYVAKHGPDFLLANDRWFRPTAEKLGPDGAVYVSDWYDKQNCHHTDPKAWDRSNGRLYKIQYDNAQKKYPVTFDLSKQSTPELVQLQSSRNEWQVRQARRILTERHFLADPKATDSAAGLKQLALTGATEESSLRGLWALYDVGGFDESIAEQTLASKYPWMRVWTVRFLGESGKISDAMMSRFFELAKSDAAPEVRSQLASTCQKLKENDTLPLLHALMLHDEDINDQDIKLLLWVAYESRLLKQGPQVIEFIKGPGADAKLVQNQILPNVIRRLTATADALPLQTCVALLADAPKGRLRQAVLDGFIAGMNGRGQVAAPENWGKTYAALMQDNQTDAAQRAMLLRLAAQFSDADAVKSLKEKAADQKAPDGERIDAIRTLASVRAENTFAICLNILDTKANLEVTREAVRALAAFKSADTATEILKRWKDFSPTLRVDCLDLLCGRKEWASQLLTAVAANQVPRTDISETAIRRMRELKNLELTKQIETAWGKVRERTPDDIKLQIDKMRKVVQAGTGTVAPGSKVFEKTCMPCHSIFGKGNLVGPELTGSGRKELNYLLINILDPNAVIGAPYYVWVVKMKDGRMISGIMAEQDDKTVSLKRENNAKEILQRKEIDVMKETGVSLMPEGLEKSLTEQEFRDLIAFLQGDGWPK